MLVGGHHRQEMMDHQDGSNESWSWNSRSSDRQWHDVGRRENWEWGESFKEWKRSVDF